MAKRKKKKGKPTTSSRPKKIKGESVPRKPRQRHYRIATPTEIRTIRKTQAKKVRSIENKAKAAYWKEITKGFVTEFTATIPIEWYNINGDLAVYPSRVRHDAERESIWKMLYRADYDGRLQSALNRLHNQTGYSKRELYTFYVSP